MGLSCSMATLWLCRSTKLPSPVSIVSDATETDPRMGSRTFGKAEVEEAIDTAGAVMAGTFMALMAGDADSHRSCQTREDGGWSTPRGVPRTPPASPRALTRPSLRLAIEINQVRGDDEWVEEPDDHERVESALRSIEDLVDPWKPQP